MAFRVQIRRDPSSKWIVNNPILLNGELGYETNTTFLKIGDGATPWNYLPYWEGGQGPAGPTGATGSIGATGATGTISYYNFAGSLSSTGVLSTEPLLTIPIPANSLTDFLNIRSVIFQLGGGATAGAEMKIWTNTTSSFNTATQIANYVLSATNITGQIERKFSLQSGLLIGFPPTQNSASGTGNSVNAMLSIAFNTAVINYLFISAQLNDITDTVTLRNVNITY